MSSSLDRTALALGAAGSAIGRRARGVAPGELDADTKLVPLKPGLAIEALLAGLRALFALEEATVSELLAPALLPWRNAVGCADRVLVAENAAREPGLLPLPLPSWCAHAIDAGLLRLEGPPRLERELVVQRALLIAVRGASAPEGFAIDFAATRAEISPHVHLAISTPSSSAFRGEHWLRAAASGEGRRLPIWLGAPSHPSAPPAPGASGLTVATATAAGSSPRWAVLRLLEDDEPQALWDLRALRQARAGREPATSVPAAAPASLRIALHLGGTACTIVEQEDAASGALGGELLGAGPASSGFLLLAGEPDAAHRFGCAPRLQSTSASVPGALCAAGPEVLEGLLSGALGPEQLWLPQAGAAPGAALRIDRFTSPARLQAAGWLPVEADLEAACGRLLETHGLLLGRALASAHAAPLGGSEGGRFVERWPRLEEAECLVAFAQPADRERMQRFGDALCEGLRSAWRSARVELISRGAATAALPGPPPDAPDRFPIQLDAHLGGQQLAISVRLPAPAGRPPLAIPGSSAVFQLGADRLLEAASFASAGARGHPSREAFGETLARLRSASESGAPAEASAIRETLLRWTTSLVQRQLAGTLLAAAPEGRGLHGAGVHVRLSGGGWNLLGLEVSANERERVTERILQRAFSDATPSESPMFEGAPVRLSWISPRRLCEGLLRAEAEIVGTPMIGTPTDSASPAPAGDAPMPELLGVDTAAGQRWFSLALEAPRAAVPSGEDAWWRRFTEGVEGPLLRADQWFAGPAPERARDGLAGGQLSFAARRSLLKQWLDLCGPSLFALHVRSRLAR